MNKMFNRETFPLVSPVPGTQFFYANAQVGSRCFITGEPVDHKTKIEAPEHLEYALIAANGGGSGKGFTYYQQAAADPKQARLNDEYQQAVRRGDKPSQPVITHFATGSAMHKLLEIWTFDLPVVLDYFEFLYDPNTKEALRLFNAYRAAYPKTHWGTPVAAEFKMPATEEGVRKSRERFFGMEINGKPDLLVDISDEDVVRLQRERNLFLPGPGKYFVDWKSSGYDREDSYYGLGSQATLYPYLYNLDNPESPVLGTIYCVIITNAKKKDKTPTFHAVFAPYNPAKVDQLRGTVAMARLGLAFDLPNFAHLTDKFTGAVNFFVSNGWNDLAIDPVNELRLARVLEFIDQLDKELPNPHAPVKETDDERP